MILAQDILNLVDSEEAIAKLECLTDKLIGWTEPELEVYIDEEKLIRREAAS